MGLVRITGVYCQVNQAVLLRARSSEMQKALETQHGLEHFRAVADRRGEAPLKMPVADAKPSAEMFYPAIRMTGNPVDSGIDLGVRRTGVLQTDVQGHFERRKTRGRCCLIGNSGESRMRRSSPNIAKRGRLIQ